MPPLDRHIDAARRRLAHLDALSARTDAAEEQIRQGAQARLDAVDSDLRRLEPRAITDPDAGAEFESLTVERGQLQQVIAQSGLQTS